MQRLAVQKLKWKFDESAGLRIATTFPFIQGLRLSPIDGWSNWLHSTIVVHGLKTAPIATAASAKRQAT
jgi:hypothetical protein